ncbi:hypothetical protein ACGF3G_00365 [Streptomyces sp. NPDC048179]|uniref:hypothetical protein n=1 Tax=Streptomyces sp. NPDC048179 TaxID=3365506 RepID=UPI003721A6D0
MPHTPDDEFTELVDANIDRVDLVDKAANGLPFLMAKAAADGGPAGLMPPDLVRDLIGKTADPAPTSEAAVGETVTMTGTPGALAQLIHKAGGRLVDDAPITKDADTMATEADLDPTAVLAEPEGNAPGDANTPGSPAWEAVDAATARKWTSILSRAKSALGVMADRELLEAAAGDGSDFDSAMNLDDAACAIDYAISVLAPFAVDEEAEVIRGTAELDAVGKALGDFDAAPLDVIESLTQVAKAGRTLSAANENAIRTAVESLQKVLASLPAAPDTQESGRPVAKKETDMPETGTAPETVETPAAAAEPIGKADGEGKPPMVAVYDAKGKLVGIVDPTEITPISGADAADEPAAPAEPAPAADDLAPAPAAEVGTPADEGVTKEAAAAEVAPTTDDVTKTTDTDSDVLKSSDIRDMVKGLLDEHSAGHTAQLTKTGEAIVELAEIVETLKGQVRTLEEQPAEPRVFAQGAVPPAHMMRGQDNGAAPIDMAKARELKQTLYTGSAPDQNAAAVEMQKGAIAALQAIHQRRPQ